MDGEVNQVLFEHYSNTLRKAVSGHFADGLDDQLRANLTRFAAYKAAHAQKTIASFIQAHKENEARACIKQMDTWLDAEYNTAVARARTAKQFAEFLAPDNPFRNLRWLPSRSADPRAAHVKFYNRIWAKGDSFWDTHSPGTEWNCKCDLEETNEPATDAGDSGLHVPRGLEGNPAKTGEIYTDEASYLRVSNTRKKKIDSYVGKKILRNESLESMKQYQHAATPYTLGFENGTTIDVIVDSKGVRHFSNDVADSTSYLYNEVLHHFSEHIKRAELVAHEDNTKQDKKPSAIHYYYYRCKVGTTEIYINVEENYVVREDRHFYRFYALTDKVRETATWY